ncbi:YtnP family quorum-quenching lactonase [Bacillus benzoevorans]|uniref:Glyoxylase-like metal-dependent hydrolase (Beta-lactamase superfamily II) n=1 Tax=Bacillus benzoevorans TaxID=1456 RepID=A0A7X0HRZ6_9BACI|nr:MBL fold metallo-hydrolase [Bacillus benzoevorans]MBB6445749.1 glyoxylase-like metal-dependent hydrolase (beta-lactamase superfamily II) [Bacillus benzoevorans]
MDILPLPNIRFTWLDGGVTNLDGGAMFGVVPKPLWEKRYPCNEKNQIECPTDPILMQMDGKNILVESGIGKGKLTEKQKRNFGVTKESRLEESLQENGLTTKDIDYVLMTHLHFDHACGLTKYNGENYISVFPNAKIIVSAIEWNEMRNPNIRSKSTYWKENWEGIADQVETFTNEWSWRGIKLIHTGGHSDGHSILVVEDGEETVVHMADIMPTHAHQNVLWVMAYDDYPMNSIAAKQKWMQYGVEKKAWFTFYHDAYYRAVKWDLEGTLTAALERK